MNQSRGSAGRKHRLAALAGVVAVSGLLGFVGWQRLLNFAQRRLREVATEQLTRALKRPVRFGTVERAGGAFVLREFVIGNAPGAPPLLQTPAAAVDLEVCELLFHRKVVVRRIALRRPALHLLPSTEAEPPTDPIAVLDQLNAFGLQEVVITDASVVAQLDPIAPKREVKLAGLNAIARLGPNTTRVTANARELRFGEHALTRLRAEGQRDGNIVALRSATAEFAGHPITASGTHVFDTRKTTAVLGGRLALEQLPLPAKVAWKPRGQLETKLSLVADGNGWQEASGSIALSGVELKPPTGNVLSGVSGRAKLKATNRSIQFEELTLRLGGFEIRGAAKFGSGPLTLGEGTPYEFSGAVATSDWKRVGELTGGKAPLTSGRLTLQFAARDRLPRVPSRLTGHFTLADSKLNFGRQPVQIKAASGAFVRSGEAITLNSVRAQFGEVAATGSGSFTPARFTVRANFSGRRFASFAEQFMGDQSAVNAGAYTVAAEVAGTPTAGPTQVSGTLRLADVKPAGGPPGLTLSLVTSSFRRTSGGFSLPNLHVAAPEFTGDGSATIEGQAFAMKGQLNVADLAGLKKLNAALANLRKGSGTVAFFARGRSDAFAQANLSGTVSARNGEWGIPGGAYGLSRIEFASAKAAFALDRGRATVSNLVIDGKDFNVTGQGAANGQTLSGAGRGRVMRSLAMKVVADAAGQKLLREVEKLPLDYLPVRLKLSGTMAAPQIGWSLEEKALQDLVVNAALKHPKLQKEIDRVKPKLKQELEKLLGKHAPPTTASGGSPTGPPPPEPGKDERKKVLDKLLKGALEKVLKKE